MVYRVKHISFTITDELFCIRGFNMKYIFLLLITPIVVHGAESYESFNVVEACICDAFKQIFPEQDLYDNLMARPVVKRSFDYLAHLYELCDKKDVASQQELDRRFECRFYLVTRHNPEQNYRCVAAAAIVIRSIEEVLAGLQPVERVPVLLRGFSKEDFNYFCLYFFSRSSCNPVLSGRQVIEEHETGFRREPRSIIYFSGNTYNPISWKY